MSRNSDDLNKPEDQEPDLHGLDRLKKSVNKFWQKTKEFSRPNFSKPAQEKPGKSAPDNEEPPKKGPSSSKSC